MAGGGEGNHAFNLIMGVDFERQLVAHRARSIGHCWEVKWILLSSVSLCVWSNFEDALFGMMSLDVGLKI